MNRPNDSASDGKYVATGVGGNWQCVHFNLAKEPFVFFLDEATGRGRVVYRRYDGHYGLVATAD